MRPWESRRRSAPRRTDSCQELPMFALLSLVVCLATQPVVCETVTPDYVYSDIGRSPTFFECLGPVGQDIGRHWLAENPSYLLRRVQCSIATDAELLRDQVESPRA
jgi:hypothetical protein